VGTVIASVSVTVEEGSTEENDHDNDGIPDSEDPDDDNDGLSDSWEEAYGLDPKDNSGVNGRDGDLDGDGWSNHEEYENETDPADSTSSPSLGDVQIVETIPIDGSGVNNDNRVPNNTVFSVRIEAPNGINLTDTASIVFTIKEGSNSEYSRDLSDIKVMKVVTLTNETDTNMSHLWVSYYRIEEVGVFYPYSEYGHNNLVTIQVGVTDREGIFMEQAFTFMVETETEHETAQDPNDLIDVSQIEPEGEHDTGIQVDSGDYAGAKIIYSDDEPLEPTFDLSTELPPLEVEGMDGVGVPLILQPHVVFANPVKIYIPCPGYSDVSELCIMYYDGEEWVAACDENGEILPGGDGWMVPGSRVNHDNGTPSTIEIQVYHFSAVQAAADATIIDPIPDDMEDTVDEIEDITDEVEDIADEVEDDIEEVADNITSNLEGGESGGGGGGCFIGTTTAPALDAGKGGSALFLIGTLATAISGMAVRRRKNGFFVN
jgi:hypothetical protein